MTTFQDGPAKGQTLMLHRSVIFLRVTKKGDVFDALDQLEDTAAPDEQLFAYIVDKDLGGMHVRASKGRGGFYRMVEYKLIANQPDDATMRDNDKWGVWVDANRGLYVPRAI